MRLDRPTPLPAASFLQLMWLASPALPVGGFSYSEGLESAIENAGLASEAAVGDWLLDQLHITQARGDMALIAKAVANSLAKKMAELRGEESREAKSYFLNIKGPELLNKFVGETERHIRLIFQRAREKASEGTPVIVFFDEMDSIFRTRGTGVSSDVETTVVPQLLSEIDGVEGLENVIVIGASNREDMIDPAILRPGRLDVKIKIERPDAEAAQDIFSKYLTEELPVHADDLAGLGVDGARHDREAAECVEVFGDGWKGDAQLRVLIGCAPAAPIGNG